VAPLKGLPEFPVVDAPDFQSFVGTKLRKYTNWKIKTRGNRTKREYRMAEAREKERGREKGGKERKKEMVG
jgi:hypothetical protein